MSRQPEQHVLEELQRYDPALDVRWVERDPSGRHIQRWLVVRRSRGEEHPVIWVENEDRSYRPFDRRVLEHLRSVDSWRVLGRQWRRDETEKNCQAVTRVMNEMGYKAHNLDTFREKHEIIADERYHDWVPDLADRMFQALQAVHSPVSGFDGGAETKLVEERTAMKKRVRAAKLSQDGELYFDRLLGCVAVRGDA